VLQEVRALSLEAQSPVDFLTHRLHPWVAFVVMPVFALANAGVTLDATLVDEPTSLRVALAVALGLVLGKPIGVAVFALAAERMGLVSLPSGVGPGALLGAGLLAGIGFTMALFITALAFGEGPLAAGAKLGTLGGSLVAFALGTSLLARVLPHRDSSDALTRAP
jgi:NhaA family Na+:H+ antiporter